MSFLSHFDPCLRQNLYNQRLPGPWLPQKKLRHDTGLVAMATDTDCSPFDAQCTQRCGRKSLPVWTTDGDKQQKLTKGWPFRMSKPDFFKGLSRKAAAPQKQLLPEKKPRWFTCLRRFLFYRRSQRNDIGGGNRPRWCNFTIVASTLWVIVLEAPQGCCYCKNESHLGE